jgi:hypothetical protein
MEGLLREISVTNGLEINQLLAFLRKVQLREHFPLQDRDFLQVIYSRCAEPLSARVNLALNSGSSFEQFHFDVLQFFVPRRLFESLKQNLFRRLQHSDESFPAYVSSVRDAALVLKLPVSEQEIINNILDGLSPAQRSHFVFQTRPSTWADVDSLCVHDRNVFFCG